MRKLLVFLWLATWLFLCLIPWLESGTDSYSAWRTLNCLEAPASGAQPAACEANPDHLPRGLILFAITAPFLAWSLLRTPRPWPSRLTHLWWNQDRAAFSLLSGFLVLAVTASAAVRAMQTPYTSGLVTNGIALGLILLAGMLYRAVHLSSNPATRPS